MADRRAAVYTSGRVNVYRRPDGRYRLTATVAGVQHERSGGRDLAGAKERADSWNAERSLGFVTRRDVRFGELLEAYLRTDVHPNWGRRHADALHSIARNHLQALAHLTCEALADGVAFNRLLVSMADDGYSTSAIDKAYSIIRGSIAYGRQLGAWPPFQDPAFFVQYPKVALTRRSMSQAADIRSARHGGGVGPVDPAEVPTDKNCLDLRDALAQRFGWKHALMFDLAVQVGLRWGELVGLQPDQFDPATRELHIYHQLNEYDDGTFEFTLPKHDKIRTVIVPVTLVPGLLTAIDEARADMARVRPSGEVVNANRLIFYGARGGWWRRSNWDRRFFAIAKAEAAWPDGLTWHDLRHRFVIDMLARGLPIEDVSRLAGHSSTNFTYRRYAQADDDYLDRVRRVTA